MRTPRRIKTLFVDIGGVLLTNGWDHPARRRAARHFQLDAAEMEARHHLSFETFEIGRLTLDAYLNRVVFHQPRQFTRAQFRHFLFAQSQPLSDMLALVRALKVRHGLKVVVVSNEARELNAHRIRTFKLTDFVDVFVSSCFVQLRKPDPAIFRLALDLAQTPASETIYLENTALFVDVAAGLGMRGIVHADYASTRVQLAALGLRVDDDREPTRKHR
ncbi:HAD hydrolase-like protein [Horticoccus luteus]|uniref:HAD hydrolase-like protein n=1 Tax=Horticoccus luteus TaxID=2862869 RepID=A0A8F9TVJ5_9BACT|nr:HAD family hydrolase [Horticoccus luteus]QYM78852.1 HAD hydrolase-like protein [Horticoccus luteus]